MQGLRSMRREKLPVGKIVVDEIRDAGGGVLVDSGVVLDGTMITLLPNVVYFSERDNKQSAEDVVDEVFRRLGRGAPVANQRRHQRRSWSATITVTIEQTCNESVSRRAEQVKTHDISRNGFSFIYRQYIPVGAKVNAEFVMLPDQPVLKATVRSCTHIGGRDHRIGVEFDKIHRTPN